MSSGERLIFQRLAAGIIAESVSDFHFLRAKGVIRARWRISPAALDDSRRMKSKLFTYTHEIEVKELINFFTNGGLEKLIDLAGFDHVSPQAIRRKLYQ